MTLQTSKINRDACAWIARLHDRELSVAERRALREWLAADPAHGAELRRMAKRWDELNILTELAVPVENSAMQRNRRRPLRISFGVAAAVAVLFILIALPWQWRANAVYSTAIGEQHLVTLPDNSTVLLNTNTRIRAEYTEEFRTVQLLQGEAHFDVAPNKQRPFRVMAGGSVVRAVGTAFSVYLKRKIVEVTVTEGRVEFAATAGTAEIVQQPIPAENKPVVVDAGQSAVFDEDVRSVEEVKDVAPEEISRKLAWRDGLLKFTGDPLEQVVEEVGRYTPLSIVILDPELRDLRIGGFFKVGETDKMFEALTTAFGVHVERVDKNIVHLSAAHAKADK